MSGPIRTSWRWISLLLLVAGMSAWILFALWGENLVRSIYASVAPAEFLNGLIKRQSVHPVEYYLDRGWTAARGVAWLMWSAAALIALYHTLLAARVLRRRSQPLLVAILFATTLFCESYILGVPIFQLLPHWFWSLRPKELENWWVLIPLAAILLGALPQIFSSPARKTRNLVFLIMAGTLVQYGMATMDGNALDGLRQRLLDTGHGSFPRVASDQISLSRVIGGYDEMLARDELADYPFGTKPPGMLVFFVLCQRLADMLSVYGTNLEQLSTLATLLFPFLTYVALVPLYMVCRQYVGTKEAWVPCCLYIALPNLVLMNMHLDQFLLPQLGLWFALALIVAQRRGSALVGVLSGVLLYLCLFVSFSLIALLALVPVVLIERGTGRSNATRTTIYLILGFAGSYGLLYAIADYSAVERFAAAVGRHSQWKVETWGIPNVVYFAILNTVEFALWCGVPVAVLCGTELYRSARSMWTTKVVAEEGTLGVALLVTGVFLLILGRTVGETGRLWMFLAPLVAFCAGATLNRLMPHRILAGTGVTIALQMAVILTLKRYQDFF